MNWIRITERKPKELEPVLVCIINSDAVIKAFLKNGEWFIYIELDFVEIMGDAVLKTELESEFTRVMAWMPMPKSLISYENNLQTK